MRIGFVMPCRAVYNTSIKVPDELTNEWFDNLNNKDIQAEILSYITKKVDEASISELEFIQDEPDKIEGIIEIYDETHPSIKSKTFYIDHKSRKFMNKMTVKDAKDILIKMRNEYIESDNFDKKIFHELYKIDIDNFTTKNLSLWSDYWHHINNKKENFTETEIKEFINLTSKT